MESSTVVAFRALVMLACLIVVPLAAILGSAFPEVVRSAILDRFGSKTTNTASNNSAPAPGFGQFGAAPAANPYASVAGTAQAPAWNAPSTAAPPAPQWPSSPTQLSINSPPPAQTPAGQKTPDVSPAFSAPAEQATPPWQRQNSATMPAIQQTAGQFPPAPGNMPVKYAGGPGAMPDSGSAIQIPVTGPGGVVQVNDARPQTSTPGPAQTAQPDRFTWIEKRLREYGATYYRLETWGDAGEFYRFHCKMAVGNNPNYTQQFEATDGDALRAMTQVLEQVEAWRGRVN